MNKQTAKVSEDSRSAMKKTATDLTVKENPAETTAFLQHDQWLDKQDILTLLHISNRTLQTWRSSGLLPHCRLGNKIFYRRSDLEKVMESNMRIGTSGKNNKLCENCLSNKVRVLDGLVAIFVFCFQDVFDLALAM